MPFIGKNPTAGFATIVKDTLTADGSTTQFTLSKQVASPTDIAVFVGNVRQEPTTAYTVNGTTLDFGSGNAPATGLDMYVLHIGGTQESSVVPADGTISTTKIASGAVTSAKLQSNAVTSAKLDTNIAVSGTLGVTGVLTPSAGIAIPSGQGIDFSAYANAAGMTSELLDDYEEGTWNPIYSPNSGSFPTISYTSTTGRYTKIGRMVFAAFSFSTNGLSSISSASGDLRIAGLPFAGHSSNPRSVSSFMAGRFASDTPLFGIIQAGSSVAVLRESFDTTTQANDLNVGGGNNKNVSEGVFAYMTD